ncbi:MAG: YibE/F family protein [Chloroflexota bacterium]
MDVPAGLAGTVAEARIGIWTDPPYVPFAGLRRNAVALGGGLLLLVLIGFLVPDLSPPPSQPPAVELLRGRIVEFLPPGDDVTAPDVRIQILVGPQRGELIDGYLQGPSGQQDLPRYDVGDEVIVNASLEPDSVFISVADFYRVPVLGLLLGLFAVAVTVVGGWRGVRSLIALALTLAVVVKVVVPLILAGWDPALVAIIAATAVTVATFLLTEGARAQTVAATLGTFGALALTALLAVGFDTLARFTELRGSEDATYLQAIGITQIDLGGLILAAIILGALGILDDVTVTQAAIVSELHDANPSLRGLALARRAMNVGRSHIAATVNTLVLAYVGASLPLLVLFAAGRQDPLLTASTEVVAVEVVRAIVGSIGIVAAVPLTTAIGVALVDRRLPFLPGDRGLARGWD